MSGGHDQRNPILLTFEGRWRRTRRKRGCRALLPEHAQKDLEPDKKRMSVLSSHQKRMRRLLTPASLAPMYLLRISGPLTLMKFNPHSLATAEANMVLPQPGKPYSKSLDTRQLESAFCPEGCLSVPALTRIGVATDSWKRLGHI